MATWPPRPQINAALTNRVGTTLAKRVSVTPVLGANSLLINGPTNAVEDVMKIVRELDTESEAGDIEVRIYKLENGAAKEVSGILEDLLQNVSRYQARTRTGRFIQANVSIDSRANSLIIAGTWMKAAQLMVRAEEQIGNPLEKVKLLYEVGTIYRERLDDEQRSAEFLARVIALDPEHVGAAEPLQEMYFRDQRWRELEPILDMLVRKADRRDTKELNQLYFRLARTADQLGNNDKALKYYKAAYDLDSTYLPTLLGRAALLYRMEDWEGAFKLYQTVLVHHREGHRGHQEAVAVGAGGIDDDVLELDHLPLALPLAAPLSLALGRGGLGGRVRVGAVGGFRRRRRLPGDHLRRNEERARHAAVLHALELELDELLDHVELAEVPVDPARRLEALPERGVQLVGVLEVLERLHARQELRLEDATEAKVIGGADLVGPARGDPFLELFDEPLPVVNGLEMRESLLKFH